MWHEALFYSSDAEYTASVGDVLAQATRRDQAVLLAVTRDRAQVLTALLGSPNIEAVDISTVGRNPSRVIPAVQGFLDRHAGGEAVVIGESFWPERSAAENAEVIRHEALVNRAFAGTGVTMVCPYRTDAPRHVIDDARRTHPRVRYAGASTLTSRSYTDPERVWRSSRRLPRPQSRSRDMIFDARGLSAVREIVRAHAIRARLADSRVNDLVVAVSELAANSIRYGRGSGRLRIWVDSDAVFCEVRDRGRLDDPLVGRRKPEATSQGGRGLWLVNQLCDLVELHAHPAGVTVRVRIDRQ